MLYKVAAEREVKAWTKICGVNGIQTRPLCHWCDVLLIYSGDMLYKRAAERKV